MRRIALVFASTLLVMGLGTQAAAAPGADLSVTQEDSKDPIRKGKKLTYLITIANAGPDTADGVALIIDLPGSTCHEFPDPSCQPAVDFLSVRPSKGVCGTEAEGFISCDFGNLAAGSTVRVRLRLIPLVCGEIRNGAFVGANNESDPFPSPNNEDFETTTVLCR